MNTSVAPVIPTSPIVSTQQTMVLDRTNRKIVLAARPTGLPSMADFQLIESPIPHLHSGELLIRLIYLSVDPYMRIPMNAQSSHGASVPIGGMMPGGAVGKVVESKHAQFRAGDVVVGDLGWQEFAVSRGNALRKIDPNIAPLTTALGVLGMTGLTAYFGLLDITQMKMGESVVVSGAAGAVGSIVGQIAKLMDCHVVGIAGGPRKISYLTEELGFDAAMDYHSEADYGAKLRAIGPMGFDVYFDNVGGAITDAVIPLLNIRGRVAVCGQISQYNLAQPELGPRWLPHLIAKRARVEGFLVSDFTTRFPEALENLTAWYREGSLKFPVQMAEGGIAAAPEAFIGMLRGDNIGKQLVKISEE